MSGITKIIVGDYIQISILSWTLGLEDHNILNIAQIIYVQIKKKQCKYVTIFFRVDTCFKAELNPILIIFFYFFYFSFLFFFFVQRFVYIPTFNNWVNMIILDAISLLCKISAIWMDEYFYFHIILAYLTYRSNLATTIMYLKHGKVSFYCMKQITFLAY